MSIDARGADTSIRPTTRVAIATVRSVRRWPKKDGSMRVGSECSTCGTFMSSSRFPQSFARLRGRVSRLSWNVYAKASFKKGKHVLDYLGRYTHRVGIANSRLLAVSEHAVTFRTKGQGSETISPVAFLGRFVQHVLPDGLHKIRHVGLYAPASAARRELALIALGDLVRIRPRRDWRH